MSEYSEENVVDSELNPSLVIASRHLKDIKSAQNRCQGYLNSKEDLDTFLEEFRVASGVTFVTRDSMTEIRYVLF